MNRSNIDISLVEELETQVAASHLLPPDAEWIASAGIW